MLSLAAIGAPALASQGFGTEDFIKGKDYTAFNSSYSNSTIKHLSHPMAAGIDRRMQISNAASASSMSHEIDSAREISGRSEYVVSSSNSQGDYENINSATTRMQIDETVSSGRVHIGVLSGSNNSAGNSGTDSLNSAWKNPAIEIEEYYIGTYHISKNFTINNSYFIKSFADSWLNCCGVSYDIRLPEPVFISADDVFNCLR